MTGYNMAQTLLRVLKQCGDNLTRENVMKQAANLRDFRTTNLLPGIAISTSPLDFAPIKQVQLRRFKGAVRAHAQQRNRRLDAFPDSASPADLPIDLAGMGGRIAFGLMGDPLWRQARAGVGPAPGFFHAPIPIWSQATSNYRGFHVGACRAQRRCRH
jgi:hypothetical protein